LFAGWQTKNSCKKMKWALEQSSNRAKKQCRSALFCLLAPQLFILFPLNLHKKQSQFVGRILNTPPNALALSGTLLSSEINFKITSKSILHNKLLDF